MWNEIKDLIKSVPNISGDYDEKYTKIKFSSIQKNIKVLYYLFFKKTQSIAHSFS